MSFLPRFLGREQRSATPGENGYATCGNVDGESRALVMRCIAPVERALNATPLSAQARRSYFVEHDLAGLLRRDMKARYEAYRIGREWVANMANRAAIVTQAEIARAVRAA